MRYEAERLEVFSTKEKNRDGENIRFQGNLKLLSDLFEFPDTLVAQYAGDGSYTFKASRELPGCLGKSVSVWMNVSDSWLDSSKRRKSSFQENLK